MRSDIIFLHAPSVYDFRKKPIFYGPVSDVIPSSPVFEMYPIGFMTISSHLEAAGFRTRIVNIAVQMLQSDSFDVERRIRGLDADVFAIDLHWMPHAHGAIELAKIVKKYHPNAKVEFGGLTSSYFHQELIQRPEILPSYLYGKTPMKTSSNTRPATVCKASTLDPYTYS